MTIHQTILSSLRYVEASHLTRPRKGEREGGRRRKPRSRSSITVPGRSGADQEADLVSALKVKTSQVPGHVGREEGGEKGAQA